MWLRARAFALYAHTIMPGLKHTDDHTFVAAFQATDRAIINPWFMISAFVGALLFTLAAATAGRGARHPQHRLRRAGHVIRVQRP